MRRCLAATLAAVSVFGAACTTPAGQPVGSARPADRDGNPPAVSAEESGRVLKALASGYHKAVRSGESRDWRDVVTEALADSYTAQARMYGPQPRSAPIELLNPALYVPRLTGPAQWFAAAALERSGRRNTQVLLLFSRRNAADRWRAAHRLAFKGKPPALDLDDQGYAYPIDSPAVAGLAAVHAGYLSGGPAVAAPARPGGAPAQAGGSPAQAGGSPSPGGGFTPDAFTTRQRGLAGATDLGGGWTKTADRFEVTGRPAHAMRTADGGALVWYDLRQTRTYESTGGSAADVLPAEVRAYLRRGGGGALGSRVTATWTWLAIGYVPARGDATVLGESVYLTEASAGL